MQTALRTFSTTIKRSGDLRQPIATAKGVVPSAPGYQRIQQLQTEWASSPGLVWQKRGGVDKLSYYAILIVSTVGVGYGILNLYKMTFPPAPAE
ncbi:DgyrCDS9154 [Dimorphilus gyrociliatus]|uniref:DgyrCDS9154 n=1 Tax=Dimorphilus gyrociliatus TaxID=2664684 RepID=A0A7I8VW83_9ANNE|nr:DgyrCDS9154 [Dimorphilus gyrociliatus]